MTNLALLIALTVLFSSSPAPDRNAVYEWRGKDRTGIFTESNLLKVWPTEGPKELWVIENLGNGYVSPMFTDDSFFLTGEADSMCILQCFNLKGEKQWETSLGREFMRTYPGTRNIATIAGDMVYVGTGMGNLFCVNRKTGKILWSKDLQKDFNGVVPLHGYSEAPVLDGDKIFWTPGGKVNNVVALNRINGKLLWSDPGFGEASGYNSPKLIKLPSRNILVTFSSYHLMSYDTRTGKLLFSHEQDNYPLEKRAPGYGDTHCNTVIYEDGAIYYAEGDGNCGVKLTLSPDGTKITEVWRNKGFDSYMGGVIKSGNFLYCGAVARPQLVSINATTGLLVDSLKVGTGALIAADNMLYYYNQKGELMLVSYNQGDIEVVSTFRVKKGTLQHFAHPVINDGILYQRHGKVLIAYDIRKR